MPFSKIERRKGDFDKFLLEIEINLKFKAFVIVSIINVTRLVGSP